MQDFSVLKRIIENFFEQGFSKGFEFSEVIEEIDTNPEVVDIINRLATFFGKQNIDEYKNEIYKECAAVAFLNLIFINGKEGKNVAIQLAKKYLQKNDKKDNSLVKQKLASFYIKTEKWEDAEACLAELEVENPRSSRNLSKLIEVYRNNGRTNEINRLIERKAKVLKFDIVIFNQLYATYKETGDTEILSTLAKYILKNRFKSISKEHLLVLRKEIMNLFSEKGNQDIGEYILGIDNKIKEEEKNKKDKKFNEEKIITEIEVPIKEEIERINELLRNIDKCSKLELEECISKIYIRGIRWFLQCQMDDAYKEDYDSIRFHLKKNIKDISNTLKPEEEYVTNFLTNIFKGNSRKSVGRFYNHENWMARQEKLFPFLLGEKNIRIVNNER